MKKTHLKWIYRSLFIAISLSIVVVFQNCAPANFVQTDHLSTSGSSEDPGGLDPGVGNPTDPGGLDPGVTATRKAMLDVSSITANNKIQLLLVIDDSYSMTDSKDRLSKQAKNLMDSLKGKDIEVGITTVWYAGASGSNSILYYDATGKQFSVPSPNSFNWAPYAGQTIRKVIQYNPPEMVPLGNYASSDVTVNIMKSVYAYYGYADCSDSRVYSYNTACRNTSDAKLNYLKTLHNKKVFSFYKNMTAEQQDILSNALRIAIEKIPVRSSKQDCVTQADGSLKCESYERGLCVVSSYLSDKSGTSFIKPSTLMADSSGKSVLVPNKVGVVIISDEDDYSGLQNEKCNHARETTYQVSIEKERTYYGKFKSIIPVGGDATLAQRILKYTVDSCKRTVVTTVDVYCDGKLCGTKDVTSTEESNTLPCATGWTKVSKSTELQFTVLTGGTYGASCTAAESATGVSQIPGYLSGNNPQVSSCFVPKPVWYDTYLASEGKEVRLYYPADINGTSVNLCSTAFTSEGIRYQNLMDYSYRAGFNSATYLTPIEGSCRYVDGENQMINKGTEILEIIPKDNNFGQALANISKTRFASGVYITSIVNLDSTCGLLGSQSIGTQFIKLSTYMGSNARTSSICNLSASDPLADLARQVTTIQKQFALALSAKEKVMSVTIIVGTRNIKVPYQNFSYANGYLTVNSNDLVAGAKIEVTIGQ